MFADPLLRYYFDQGVYRFGRMVEGLLDAAERRVMRTTGKNKQPNERALKQARMTALSRALGLNQEKKRYRNPGTVTSTKYSA